MRLAAASVFALVFAGFTSVASAGSPAVKRWLSWNGARRAASITLVAGYSDANNGFNFDGYGRGTLLVRVPLGWRVAVTCRNASSLRHSCAIVGGTQTIQPAFATAATSSPTVGLLTGQTAHFAFIASRAGSYRMTSLVPGDEQARLWDVLEVGDVAQPSISTRAGF